MDESGKKKRSRKRGKRSATADAGSTHKEASAASPSKPGTEASASKEFLERNNPYKPSGFASSASNGQPQRGTDAAKQSTLTSARGHLLERQRKDIGRDWTLSVALPGSIILNAQTPELQARLAGGLARTCAIFNVDEVIVFHEDVKAVSQGHDWTGGRRKAAGGHQRAEAGADGTEERSAFDPDAFLARILQYLETPQYLRKALFPMHKDLRLAGLLPPLDCPHHLRYEDVSTFREGVVVESDSSGHHGKKRRYDDGAAHNGNEQLVEVDVGLGQPIRARVSGDGPSANEKVPTGVRVTVRMPPHVGAVGKLVSPRQPVKETGGYWGYSVRLCNSLSEVLTTCPFGRESTASPDASQAEYDLVLGTSERGTSLTELLEGAATATSVTSQMDTGRLKPFKHALLVLGGLSGLEVIIDQDPTIDLGAHQASLLFDVWINVLEKQGSRTIRTEEALPIALARLKTFFEAYGT
ncbi:DUF171-domain-containing protein [Ceraceosorus guamensis]|uniref:DUF171-domain-containing protein n=1 Tax=Ceraceosorus guamensis TaxID=1522189 RepID=A0A316WBE6_9BASI|nr:DUF171-domain-containing protein [Ceraceosorus guamensis]PWN45253.1 DUF171-domain-containing protein [Ceraceosorus guamensis]